MDGLRSATSGRGEIGSPLSETVVRRYRRSPSIAVHVVRGRAIEYHSVEIRRRSDSRIIFESGPAVVRQCRRGVGRRDFPYAADVASGEIDLAFRVRSGETSEISVVGGSGHSEIGRSSCSGRVDVGLGGEVVACRWQSSREMRPVDRHRSGYRVDLSYDVVPCRARYLVSVRYRRKGSPGGRRENRERRENRGTGGETDSFFQTFREVVHGTYGEDG